MIKVTNLSGSNLSVGEQNLPPSGSVTVAATTPMIEYLRASGAVKVERVFAPVIVIVPPPAPKIIPRASSRPTEYPAEPTPKSTRSTASNAGEE